MSENENEGTQAMRNIRQYFNLVFILLITLTINPASSCTRILFYEPGKAVLVGNNMDWFKDLDTNLVVYPRGIHREGKTESNSLKWVSKYGSIVATAYDEAISTNGLNEKGLAAHLLALFSSNYGSRDQSRPGIQVTEWPQFFLDNFASVAEAVSFTKQINYQPVSSIDPKTHHAIALHIAIEDATGDSAIFEVVDGKINIYHDASYKILTNDPPYPMQLQNLKKYDGFGGYKHIPGTSSPSDRFVRASYYLKELEGATREEDRVFGLLSVLQNAGTPYSFQLKTSASIWRTISDLSNRVYYFNSTKSFNIIWAKLDAFDLSESAPIMKLELNKNKDLAGNVSNRFLPKTL